MIPATAARPALERRNMVIAAQLKHVWTMGSGNGPRGARLESSGAGVLRSDPERPTK